MPFPLKSLLFVSISTLTLSACTPTTTEAPPTSPEASPSPASAIAPSTPAASAPTPAATPHAEGAQQGGQVVEMGNYHLELLAVPEGDKIHVDFWLLTGSDHGAIADAKVTANIQFPNGTQKTVEMTYDTAGQHYKALIPGFVAGEYRVVVQTDTQGEKVNGRFNFSL